MCPQFDSGSCHHKFEGADPAPFFFMKYLLKNLCNPVNSEQNLSAMICSVLKISSNQLINWSLLKRALDTRKKNSPLYVYTIEVELDTTPQSNPNLILLPELEQDTNTATKLSNHHPYIIGMGPAGLFCALAMVEQGLKPYLFDRGDSLETRTTAVSQFWQNGTLDPESNVQYGEGGAGAFSDGKLTSRSNNNTIQQVFDLLIRFGAHDSIRWEALPHLGTDVIRKVVQNIRDYLIEQGCSFFYRSKLENIELSNGHVNSITINGVKHQPELLVLALGNAARDTLRVLNKQNVAMESKPYALGFRIAHPQEWIDKSIYGSGYWATKLGAASYRMTAPKAGKGTYTFCMCPGGYIIAASSEPCTMVTNGMSYASRDFAWGNSAIVTSVNPDDYGNSLWGGLELQAQIEHKAYFEGYPAPIQSATDFMSHSLNDEVTIPGLFPGYRNAQVSDFFSANVVRALKDSLKHFDNIMPGFIRYGTIIAPETRTSSPIRIVRDSSNLNCHNISNLYAIGEGAGYSGGIISSSADGYKTGAKFSG